MIALYIVLGLCALIVLILLCPVGLDIALTNQNRNVFLGVLFLRFRLYPGKNKTVKYKKIAKKLKNIRISDISPQPKKKKEESKKAKKKIERTGIFTDDLIAKISEMNDEPEGIFLLLNALKELITDFKNSLHLEIRKIAVFLGIDNAGARCIVSYLIDSSLRAFLKFASENSKMKEIENGTVFVSPVKNSDTTEYDIDIRFRFRVYSLLKALIKSFKKIKSTKIISESEE